MVSGSFFREVVGRFEVNLIVLRGLMDYCVGDLPIKRRADWEFLLLC